MQDARLINSLPYLIARAHRQVHGDLDRILKREKLPVEQWRVLELLGDREGRAMSALSQQVLMNLPALSKIVDRMVSRSLVHRKQDTADQRRVLVYITDFGLELLERCRTDVSAYEKALSRKLGSADAERLRLLLSDLASQDADG